MDNTYVHKGWLTLNEDFNCHETVELNGEPIGEELDYMSGNIVTVRYYISDKEATEEELQEDFLINTLYGNLESEYGAFYSEVTGYLWTDDKLNIGGHDLRKELESYVGKYLYLIVAIDEESQKKNVEKRKQNIYYSALNTLVSHALWANKDFEDVVKDLKLKYKK